ncbi:MAG: hypothetical protein REI09_07545 [Candidatus Dactylopiibacterium sp.]|nr:hypothetical protein [Candidatus Dactylopiibacterium sp.]
MAVPAFQRGGSPAYSAMSVLPLQARLTETSGVSARALEAPAPFVPSSVAAQMPDRPVAQTQTSGKTATAHSGLNLPVPRAFDSPPALLGEIFLESVQAPDTAGFVINFSILVGPDGRAAKVVVTSNWLDEDTTRDLVRQLEQASYRPAIRDGQPVFARLEGGLGLQDNEKGPTDAGPGNSLSTQR